MTRLGIGAAIGLTFGVAVVAACAGSAPASEVEPSVGAPAGELARRDEAPSCPYGKLEDPHRGFVRCLTPDERDAGWLPPPPQAPPAPPPPSAAPEPAPPPTATADPAPSAPPPIGPPPAVEIGSPKFENGQVPKIEKALGKMRDGIAKCVAENGGLAGASGNVKVQFLVRHRGRAEGVEILSAKGVNDKAKTCIRVLVKNRPVGAPSSDPVGVTVTVNLKAK